MEIWARALNDGTSSPLQKTSNFIADLGKFVAKEGKLTEATTDMLGTLAVALQLRQNSPGGNLDFARTLKLLVQQRLRATDQPCDTAVCLTFVAGVVASFLPLGSLMEEPATRHNYKQILLAAHSGIWDNEMLGGVVRDLLGL